MDRAAPPLAPALTLIAISKVASAGIAMYAFLRVRALHPLAALMGATSFMFSGLLVVWLQWSYASTLIFFPLLFAAVEWLRIRDGRRPMAILALVVALDAFAGYPQGFLLGLVSAGAWALYRAWGAGARFLVRCGVAVALGLLLASVQLLPFIEYARHSAVLAYRTGWLPPLHASLRSAVNLLMPYYYGSPTGGDYWGEWNFNEMSASVGLAPWVLLPVALVARRHDTAFFGLMTLAAGAPVLRRGRGVGRHRLLRHQLPARSPHGLSALRLGRHRNGRASDRAAPFAAMGLYRCEDRLRRAGGARLPLVDVRLRHHAGRAEDCWPTAVSVVSRSADRSPPC